MTALAHRFEPAPCAGIAVVSNDLADLVRIYEPEVNLCLIHREVADLLQTFVTELLRCPQDIDLAEEVRFEHFEFGSLLPTSKHIPGHDAWRRDVARLTAAFCDLFEIERVGLRLRTLDQPMCPRFHVDHVPCRLVCTYGAVGTQWLPAECVDRTKLGPGAKGLPDEESGLFLDQTAIRTMPAYSVALMKGAKWAGNEGHGAATEPSPQHRPLVLLRHRLPLRLHGLHHRRRARGATGQRLGCPFADGGHPHHRYGGIGHPGQR